MMSQTSKSLSRILVAACVSGALAAVACTNSGTAPSTPKLTVTSASPSSGPTYGGTPITLTGTNFVTGMTLLIGGTAASSLIVAGPTSMTAVTPAHAAGVASVVVSGNGETASLASGFSYVAPSGSAPVISSIVAQGSGPDEPPQFASLGESVSLTATVLDADTPASQLAFTWSASTGTISGSGAKVTWTAPGQIPTSGATAATVNIGLTVADTTFNQTQSSTTLRLHDSVKEVGDLAYDFLLGFSQNLPTGFVMRNFTNSCPTALDERGQVEFNNEHYTITFYTVGTPQVTVGFTGACPFRNVFGEACAQVAVHWVSTDKTTGISGGTHGTDQVTAVLENDQWKLCASDYDFVGDATSSRIKR